MKDPNSLSFIRFQCILHDSAVLFLGFFKFRQIKEGGPNFSGEPIVQNSWIISSPLLYFNFRSLKDPNFSSFIRFQCVLHDAVLLFPGFWNFLKLESGYLISCSEPILENSWIIWSPLLFFNFRSLKDPNSLSFIRFQCSLHDLAVLFPGFWNFLKLKRGGPNLLGGSNSPEHPNYLVPASVFQF